MDTTGSISDADTLTGDNTLHRFRGDDTLNCGAGNDKLWGWLASVILGSVAMVLGHGSLVPSSKGLSPPAGRLAPSCGRKTPVTTATGVALQGGMGDYRPRN